MRVLTGQAKGARLRALGRAQVRPTTSRVRSALFSILPMGSLEGMRVLDMYAGTGALGIEALSRGAASVDFVERDHRQCKLIRDNLSTARLRERTQVYCMTAHKALSTVAGPYDLVLLDPPYEDNGVAGLLPALAASQLLSGQTTIVLEHAWRNGVIDAPPGFALQQTRRYGDTALTFYTRSEPS